MSGDLLSVAAVTAFVYREARLIDEKRYAEWFDLFSDDARYWLPLTRGQPDGENHTSLLYEDRFLLKLRIERLANPRSFSQQQPSFCQHILQAPTLESRDAAADRCVTRTPFVYLESQLDRQLVLGGVSWLHLRVEAGRLRIQMKKVELLNCDAALPSIQLFP